MSVRWHTVGRQVGRVVFDAHRIAVMSLGSSKWEPPADVFEDECEIVVVIAMPGVTPERMQILSKPGVLIVRGARPLPLVGPGHSVRHLEISRGTFKRRIMLSPSVARVRRPRCRKRFASGGQWACCCRANPMFLRAVITTVMLPAHNERDLKDNPRKRAHNSPSSG